MKNQHGQPAKAELLGYTQGSVHPQTVELIEAAGRTCYKSTDKITSDSAPKFVDMVMRRGHESVIEHSWFVVFLKSDGANRVHDYLLRMLMTNSLLTVTERDGGYGFLISGNARIWRDYFRLLSSTHPIDQEILDQLKAAAPILFQNLKITKTNETSGHIFLGPDTEFALQEKIKHFWAMFRFTGGSRAFTHQLVRHRRLIAFSQESQRYCDESGFFGNNYFAVPPSITNAGPKVLEQYLAALKRLDEEYLAMQALKGLDGKRLVLNEDARFLLPNAVCAEIVMSAPLSEWRWFCHMRCGTHAQWEIREFAMQSLIKLKEIFPDCFADFEIAPDGKSAEIKNIQPQGIIL